MGSSVYFPLFTLLVRLTQPALDLGVYVGGRGQGNAAIDAPAAKIGRGRQPLRWRDARQDEAKINAGLGGGLDERELFGAGKRHVSLARLDAHVATERLRRGQYPLEDGS